MSGTSEYEAKLLIYSMSSQLTSNHIIFRSPLNFDVFSIGLVFCQLLFNLLDDRTDAGFRQQLEDADYDLDLWLERELQATLRPVSLRSDRKI